MGTKRGMRSRLYPTDLQCSFFFQTKLPRSKPLVYKWVKANLFQMCVLGMLSTPTPVPLLAEYQMLNT